METDLARTASVEGTGPSRRTVLRAVAVSGAGAALLAACGGGDDDTTTAGSGASDSPNDAETPEESTAGTPEEGTGGGALVAVADVPVGGGVILEAEKVVVTQPTEGTFKAFSAVCTHQSCTVASVKKSGIGCACHGSSFDISDGSVLGGPATRALEEITVTVEDDKVVQS